MQRKTSSEIIANLFLISVFLLLLGSAIVFTWGSLRFTPENPAELLAVLRRLWPARRFSYLGSPGNIQKLLRGVADVCPFAWAGAFLTLVLFSRLSSLLVRMFDDLRGLPSLLRDDISRIRDVFSGERWTLGALAIIFAAGSVLRVKYVATDMNGDELLKFFDTSYHGPLVTATVYGQEALHNYSNHLMYLGWKIFGLNHWGIRWHSITVGSLLIVLTFVCGSYFYNRYVGLTAAAMVSGSAVLIAYSVYGRSHIHIAFLGMFVLLLVHRGIWYGRRGYIYIAAVFTALGFYGLPNMVVFFAAALVILGDNLIRSIKSGNRAPWRVYLAYPGITGLFTGLLFAPFIVVSGYQEFMDTLTAHSIPFGTGYSVLGILSAALKSMVLYRQLLPEWVWLTLLPGLIVGGALLSVLQAWRGRAMLIVLLLITTLVAWMGMGFYAARLYSYMIPFFGMAVGIIAIEGWRAGLRMCGQATRGVCVYASVVSFVILSVGLGYSGVQENVFGTRAEERVFGGREDRLVVPNAQGVGEMVKYLKVNGLLRSGVAVDSDDYTFRYPILFALLENGYLESEHFNVRRRAFQDPVVVYMVYAKDVEPPEYIEYPGSLLRQGRELMVFARSKLVEFVKTDS